MRIDNILVSCIDFIVFLFLFFEPFYDSEAIVFLYLYHIFDACIMQSFSRGIPNGNRYIIFLLLE